MDSVDDLYWKGSKSINIFRFNEVYSTGIEKYISSQFDKSNSDDNSNSNFFIQVT